MPALIFWVTLENSIPIPGAIKTQVTVRMENRLSDRDVLSMSPPLHCTEEAEIKNKFH